MRIKRWIIGTVSLLIVLAAVVFFLLPRLNDYQTRGELKLPGLSGKVSVVRDEKGMAAVYADSRDDAIRGYGFVTAQDRLFQMDLLRRIALGRISELAGEAGLQSDIFSRTIGFARMARDHAALLNDENRRYLQAYIDGINAFITGYPGDHHLEFTLARLAPEPWKIEDSLAIMYYMSWMTSANVRHELLASMITDAVGEYLYREIEPVNVNPDARKAPEGLLPRRGPQGPRLGLIHDPQLLGLAASGERGLGSNNWAVAPSRSGTGSAVLAGDPHLDTGLLPGPLYPCTLITPKFRITGAGLPGLPVMITFRSSNLAVSVTNAYGDSQDLFVETVDPANAENYREGGVSRPFERSEEVVRVRDPKSQGGVRHERIIIKKTSRGPVISGSLKDFKTTRVVTVRWAPLETMGPELGFPDLMFAEDTTAAKKAISLINYFYLNFVVADTSGSLLYHVSGKLPIRRSGGDIPWLVDGSGDPWIGWIPFEQMPGARDPLRGWTGTCNHRTVPDDYPWYYSSYFSSSFRYRRLSEVMAKTGPFGVKENWDIQRDVANLFGRELAPIFAGILRADDRYHDMGDILYRWNHRDEKQSTGAALFQVLLREAMYRTFEDDLGPDLTAVLIDNEYFWKERFLVMCRDPQNRWFDNRKTAPKEGLHDVVIASAGGVERTIMERTGKRYNLVTWGDLHRFNQNHPLFTKGILSRIAGTGPRSMDGSGETLYRARYRFSDPFSVKFSSAARMVADLSDTVKVAAVMPAGVTDRLFHPHAKDQAADYLDGTIRYWWLSDEAIMSHGAVRYVLVPR